MGAVLIYICSITGRFIKMSTLSRGFKTIGNLHNQFKIFSKFLNLSGKVGKGIKPIYTILQPSPKAGKVVKCIIAPPHGSLNGEGRYGASIEQLQKCLSMALGGTRAWTKHLEKVLLRCAPSDTRLGLLCAQSCLSIG